MNSNHKAVRDFLSNLPPKRAVEFVESFFLPDNEAMVVIECDVRRKSCVQVSMERNMSVETVKRHRCRAYHKIAQELFIPLP
nr:MAG TPA: PROTEIN/DNA Complex-DNA Complex, Helix-Turn-Helix, Double Helix.3A [Caudoviricetes sp.]